MEVTVDQRIEKLAKNLVTYSCRVEKGEKVLIETIGEDPKNLVKALEGKSVYTNIKKLISGKTKNKYEIIKVYSSLLTHAAIFCEKEPEYEILFESILNKIWESIGE